MICGIFHMHVIMHPHKGGGRAQLGAGCGGGGVPNSVLNKNVVLIRDSISEMSP